MRTMFHEGITLNEQPVTDEVDLASVFTNTKQEDDFCIVCFADHGTSKCNWVTRTQQWYADLELRRLRRLAQADQILAANRERMHRTTRRMERNAIRRARKTNPEALDVLLVEGALYKKRDTFRPNATHAEIKAQEYQLWLLGTRHFGLDTQVEDGFDEEDAFFAEVEAKEEAKVVNGLRKMVGSLLKTEGVTLTAKQAKRLRKKMNRGGRKPNTSAPKNKGTKIKAKTYDVKASEKVRAIKLSLRNERKEQVKQWMEIEKIRYFLTTTQPTIQVTLDMGYTNVPVNEQFNDWVIPGFAAVMGA